MCISHSTTLQFYRFINKDSRYKSTENIRLLSQNSIQLSQNLINSKYFKISDNKDEHKINENKIIRQLTILTKK